MRFKNPVSVLVLIFTKGYDILLLERCDKPGFWQSVTGSVDHNETLEETVIREVKEETGIEVNKRYLKNWNESNDYKIYKYWRWKYAPGVKINTEHIFSLYLPSKPKIKLSPREHLNYEWVIQGKARSKVFSATNAHAIKNLATKHIIDRDTNYE